jgi:hypothetical protein
MTAITLRRRVTRGLTATLAVYGETVRTRSYFPLWLGQLISNFGDTVHYIALVVLVYRLSGQSLVVGGVVAAEALPLLLLGPVAGVVVDRFNRKAVLISADVVRGALALSLVWPQGVWHAYAVAAGMAAAGSFFNPAVQAVIPAVTTQAQRLAANSVAWSTGRLGADCGLGRGGWPHRAHRHRRLVRAKRRELRRLGAADQPPAPARQVLNRDEQQCWPASGRLPARCPGGS